MANSVFNQQDMQFNPAAELRALPLDVIIAQPLQATVQAQLLSAKGTEDFINSMLDTNGQVRNVTFSTMLQDSPNAPAKGVTISAPLLSIVPIPNLKIDSLSISFKYEISQTATASKTTDAGAEGTLKLGTKLLPFLSADFSGHITSNAKHDATTNRSGTLDIELRASQSAVPEGLATLLNILSKSITVAPKP